MKAVKKITIALAAMFPFSDVDAREWQPDVLGESYEMTRIEQPDDYSGKVRSTVIRHTTEKKGDKALLYVHGYNDYFFQSELGDSVVSHGLGFYAVDLRKYGRSLMEGQNRFEVRSLKEYFADVDSALNVMKEDGYREIVLMGHSTGGLILSYYMSNNQDQHPEVRGLVLNSPFLDMNLSKFLEKVMVPVVSVLPFKNIKISQGDSNAYAQSLLKGYHGEWSYDTSWKLEVSPDVTTGWVRAIHKGQKHLWKHAGIKVPILLMHSDKSVYGDEWSPAHNSGDAVLDVDDISKYGRRLGDKVTEVTVTDGLHDLILSRRDVREKAYASIFEWIDSLGLSED